MCTSRRPPPRGRSWLARARPLSAGPAATGADGWALTTLGVEHVAGLPHGPDQRRPGGVELPAEVAHVRLDDVRVPAEVVVPDVLEDLRLREHAARVEHEETEQRELGSRQRDLRLASEHLVSPLVEDQISVAKNVTRKLARGAAQERLDPCHDLREAERLRHVVVPSRAQGL